jgi:hypothetical protein
MVVHTLVQELLFLFRLLFRQKMQQLIVLLLLVLMHHELLTQVPVLQK